MSRTQRGVAGESYKPSGVRRGSVLKSEAPVSGELVALLRQFATRLVKENGGSDSARVREQLRIVNGTAKAILVEEFQKLRPEPTPATDSGERSHNADGSANA